jgi:hypothetical protein
MALTLVAYLVTMWRILPHRDTVLVALAFPAVFVNLGHGQNGFLTAALLGGALLRLNQRPVVAGILFGLMAYKPQFGLLIPLALLAQGRWTVLAVAAITVLVECLVTIILFGPDVWYAFFESTEFTRRVVLEQGNTGWEKIQSAFAAVRMLGGGIEPAYSAQLALTFAAAAGLVWLWRSRSSYELKAAGLACACLLATPYLLDYDLVVVAVAIAFLVRHGLTSGFRNYEISCLVLAWTVPLLARSVAGAVGVPLGLMSVLLLYGLTLRRAMIDLGYGASLREVIDRKPARS